MLKKFISIDFWRKVQQTCVITITCISIVIPTENVSSNVFDAGHSASAIKPDTNTGKHNSYYILPLDPKDASYIIFSHYFSYKLFVMLLKLIIIKSLMLYYL